MKRRSLWIFGSVPFSRLTSPSQFSIMNTCRERRLVSCRRKVYTGLSFGRPSVWRSIPRMGYCVASTARNTHAFGTLLKRPLFRLARQRLRLDEVLREHSRIRICLCRFYNLFLNYSMVKVVLNLLIRILMQFSIRIQWLRLTQFPSQYESTPFFLFVF